ncbi:uncharacterized protein DUF4136 [Dokdonia sp. Hel_I_53]|nr:uncharacterized protein DUF4136 [Dokdonia sp. Hel_I_53]
MRIFLCLITIATLNSCGSTFVEYDYDKNVDFSKYQTFAYDYENISGFSDFDEKRFTKAVDTVLEARGWAFSETAEMLIGAQSTTYETTSRNALGVGIGGSGGSVGVGVSGGIPMGGRELHRVLTLTMYDENSKATIWEAISESDLKVNATPEQREEYFYNLISKILKKFPPERN